MNQQFIVIGLDDNRLQPLSPEVLQWIQQGNIFSGGVRHRKLVQELLPPDTEWINITVPLDKVFRAYQPHRQVIVFASGDPLFFGFANTIKRQLPEADIIVYPYFNSLQLLAHRLLMPYDDMRTVSLTGRPWEAFDRALIERSEKIGVLTDREHTPATIAARMQEYNYHQYTMYVGEHLGNPEQERVRHLTLHEATESTFTHPNNLLLAAEGELLPRPFGIPDEEFDCLAGRTRMMTKAPIRLMTLSELKLRQYTSFWDIGSCTGSISIEARLQFPHLKVNAFEIRPEGQALMDANSRRFGAPGIDLTIGNFMELDLTAYPAPDAVFIGGHGNRLREMIQRMGNILLPGGIIAMNCVKPESKQLFLEGVADAGLEMLPTTCITLNSYNPIEILKAVSPSI